jgi:PilZ domain-containing protein
MEKHAYINIEPNNGGIVLNVSEGGLCFHSYDPVPKKGTIRFWFSDNGQRIEADGTLAWIDETQKGGLRFVALPAEARDRIRRWMSPASMPSAAEAGSPPVGLRPVPAPISPPYVKAAASAAMPPAMKVAIPLNGFSKGLVTGLLISSVVAGAVLFHVYRREFGEELIQLGERFAAKPEAQPLTVSAAAPVVSPAPVAVAAVAPPSSPAPRMTAPAVQAESAPPRTAPSVPAPFAVARAEKVPEPEKIASRPSENPAKPQPAKLEFATQFSAPPPVTGEAVAKDATTVRPPASSSASPTIPVATLVAATAPTTEPVPAAASALNLAKPDTAPKLNLVNQPGLHTEGSEAVNAASSRELYFEVGKFKNSFQAHDESDKLAQLGFPVTAVQKGFLWTNSTHVLVGPYFDEEQAKATHENLLSSGFKPRPFEKGWRNFTILSTLTLNGERTPEGDYTISWESYVGDASVKFIRNNSLIVAAGGRWVKRDVKYPRDAYVYRKNPDGSRTLLEIHFGGMRQALVFGKAS